ncbi:MAG: FAD-binding oxidoreductase [Desulfatibacillaceae bacterium]
MALSDKALRRLRKILGEKHVLVEDMQRVCHAYDATNRVVMPDAVAMPENAEQVADVIRLANKLGFAVIPRGAGTGMTGGCLAVRGGVILSTSRMNRILAIDGDNMVATVQPGVFTGAFQREVEALGLFYPPDPSSADYCTLGGNVAECAGGPRAVKYGVTRDYVLGLAAVTGAGEHIRTGVRTAKGVVGYDLTRLVAGSEGTLAVITEITLRLVPKPESVRTLTAVYDSMEDAARTVSAVFRAGIVPRAVEYLDRAAIACAEDYLNTGLPTEAAAILLLAVDGPADQTAAQEKRLAEVCREQGAREVSGTEDQERADKLWSARKALSPALFRYGPDKINEDIVVPRSRIPEMVRRIDEIRERTGLVMVTFGHAGDGNMHVNIMLDKSDPVVRAVAEKAVDEVFDTTLALGGTISGEHGVGITKAPWMGREVPEHELSLMRSIKQVFDPNGVLNPGKMFE